jgi:hypothetical protein
MKQSALNIFIEFELPPTAEYVEVGIFFRNFVYEPDSRTLVAT